MPVRTHARQFQAGAFVVLDPEELQQAYLFAGNGHGTEVAAPVGEQHSAPQSGARRTSPGRAASALVSMGLFAASSRAAADRLP
jgi:hypothetical protein